MIYWDICTEIQQSDTNLRYISISLWTVCMLIRATAMPSYILMPCMSLNSVLLKCSNIIASFDIIFLPLKVFSFFFTKLCYPSLFLDKLTFEALFVLDNQHLISVIIKRNYSFQHYSQYLICTTLKRNKDIAAYMIIKKNLI